MKYSLFGKEPEDKDYKKVEDINYVHNPTAGTVELDLEAIRKEVKLAMEAQFTEDGDFVDSEEDELEPDIDVDAEASNNCKGTAKMFREHRYELEDVIAYDYLEGDTGFLAIKDSFDRCYADDGNPEFLYYQDVDNLRDEYDLLRNDYDYSLYEFMMVYDADDSWHIASLGLSNMTAEVDTIDERYDAEYTMRIKKLDDEELDSAERANAINLVSVLADEALKNDCMLEDYSYVSVGHEEGMDYKHLSDKVAFIIVPDARIGSVEGPFGTVHLRQAVPITKAEYDALKSKKIDVKTLYEKIGTDLVDYARPSVI
ncbi:MAG: suppressor of fused domain protein [Oscillospiraceae bacterium]|nr:suppressor of fused domain protein [Oscillospiraceae bacterium]